ncbi:MAG: hypothetical protein V4611_01170 [Patescibacteria group bacterium]
MSQLVGLIGPSGAGKSSVVKILCEEYGFQYIKSFTTRLQRDADDADHIFVSKEKFGTMEADGEFFGTIDAFDASYGLPRFTLYAPTVLLLRAPAVKLVLSQFPDAQIVEIDASIPVLKERLEKRGSSERFESEMLEKEMAYGRTVATQVIDTSNLSPEQVAKAIIDFS